MAYKTFKEYYDEDEEFKKKHLERLNEKIECECGFITARANYTRHKKSHLHIKKMEEKEAKIINKKLTEMEKEKQAEINKIMTKIQKEKKKLEKIEKEITKIQK